MLHEIHLSYLREKYNARVMFSHSSLNIDYPFTKITVRELRIILLFYWPLICDMYIKQYFSPTDKRRFQKLFLIDFKSLKNCNYRSDENSSSAKC